MELSVLGLLASSNLYSPFFFLRFCFITHLPISSSLSSRFLSFDHVCVSAECSGIILSSERKTDTLSPSNPPSPQPPSLSSIELAFKSNHSVKLHLRLSCYLCHLILRQLELLCVCVFRFICLSFLSNLVFFHSVIHLSSLTWFKQSLYANNSTADDPSSV